MTIPEEDWLLLSGLEHFRFCRRQWALIHLEHQWVETHKREVITHPFLEEKLPWGLVPYVQALLLTRFLRDDLDAYPPFLWK